jgi:hypothetical protein
MRLAGFLKKLSGGGGRGAGSGDISGGETLSDPDLTLARANNEMEMFTRAAIDLWGMDVAAWNADLEAGTITFTNDQSALVVKAPVQVVGTYNTDNGTWLWGWDHPSIPEPLREYARLARDFGERYGLDALTTRKIAASMDDAWEFTALACHLGGGQGGYSGPSGPTRVFMVYGEVEIRKNG